MSSDDAVDLESSDSIEVLYHDEKEDSIVIDGIGVDTSSSKENQSEIETTSKAAQLNPVKEEEEEDGCDLEKGENNNSVDDDDENNSIDDDEDSINTSINDKIREFLNNRNNNVEDRSMYNQRPRKHKRRTYRPRHGKLMTIIEGENEDESIAGSLRSGSSKKDMNNQPDRKRRRLGRDNNNRDFSTSTRRVPRRRWLVTVVSVGALASCVMASGIYAMVKYAKGEFNIESGNGGIYLPPDFGYEVNHNSTYNKPEEEKQNWIRPNAAPNPEDTGDGVVYSKPLLNTTLLENLEYKQVGNEFTVIPSMFYQVHPYNYQGSAYDYGQDSLDYTADSHEMSDRYSGAISPTTFDDNLNPNIHHFPQRMIDMSEDGNILAVTVSHTVKIYKFSSEENQWKLAGNLSEKLLGRDITIRLSKKGDYIIIGDYTSFSKEFTSSSSQSVIENTGSVFVYNLSFLNGEFKSRQVGQILYGMFENNYFGKLVDITNDGKRILVTSTSYGNDLDPSEASYGGIANLADKEPWASSSNKVSSSNIKSVYTVVETYDLFVTSVKRTWSLSGKERFEGNIQNRNHLQFQRRDGGKLLVISGDANQAVDTYLLPDFILWNRVNYDENHADEGSTKISLSNDGTRLIVAYVSESTNVSDQPPYARVYDFDAVNDEWEQNGDDIFFNGSGYKGNDFVSSISLSQDGDRFVIVYCPNDLKNSNPGNIVKIYSLRKNMFHRRKLRKNKSSDNNNKMISYDTSIVESKHRFLNGDMKLEDYAISGNGKRFGFITILNDNDVSFVNEEDGVDVAMNKIYAWDEESGSS